MKAQATLSQIENNLLAAWADCWQSDITTGSNWYSEAYEVCAKIASETGLPTTAVIGVMAVTSPRLSWTANLKVTWQLCNGKKTSGVLSNSINKAERVLMGEYIYDVIGDGSPKVLRFYEGIKAKGETSHVCVDVWAIRVAYANPVHDGSITHSEYALIERAYQNVANYVGLAPAKFQAVLWIRVRQGMQGRLF